MNAPKMSNRPLVQLATNYWQWKWLWITTTGIFGMLGLLYVVFFKQDVWEASQGLIVRDEANGAVMRLGRFESQTAMKAAQETVLEMARNSQVLHEALTTVGVEKSFFSWGDSDSEPTNGQIESLADHITVRAPQGAEFGTTEVIYLQVSDTSRTRAVELTKAVCDALERRLKRVRQVRAEGVISELSAAKEAALQGLNEVTARMERIEAEIGTDLSDLRSLTDVSASGSQTRQVLDNVSNEIRAAELERQRIETDLQLAKDSFENPDDILQTPTQLVNSQPGLKRLREGLAAASIVTSELKSKYTMNHPAVIASIDTEKKIRRELRNELGNSVQTLTKDYQLATARVDKLKAQKKSLEDRIAKLAAVRAKYGNIVNEVSARNQQLRDAERELASAAAARSAAETSSLLTRIDQPIIGEDPVGPGRTTVLGGALAAGLVFGFGLVFLVTPMDAGVNYGRRSLDYSGKRGRRSSDFGDASAPVTTTAKESPTNAAEAAPGFTNPLASSAAVAPNGAAGANANAASSSDTSRTSETTHSSHQTSSNSAARAQVKKNRTISGAIAQERGESDPATFQNVQSVDANPVETDRESLEAAQAVIAAALSGSLADEANAPPKKES